MVNGQKIAWKPLPGSQSLAITCPCDEILYHGTRGSSKSTAQLAAFLKLVGAGYGKHWKGVIFDRGYKNLADLISKSREIIPACFPTATFNKAHLNWEFEDGEVLMFRHAKSVTDYDDYHGQEFPFIGWNELTNYCNGDLYELMKSCNRTGFLPAEHSPDLDNPLPDIPLVIFSTTNPHGIGHTWVKKKFIDVSPYGVPVTMTSRIFNPRTQQEEDVTNTQVAIFGSYKENKYLDPKYIAKLDAITDKSKRRAWLGGDWSITAGGALDDLWKASVHIVPRFPVPDSWTLDRSFDWGSSHPFSVCFWAKANGEEVDLPDGSTWCPAAGSLILLDEIYGGEESLNPITGRMEVNYGSNKGLRLSAREVARRIVERETELVTEEWITDNPQPGPADNQIHNVNELESGSIAKMMGDEGIQWTKSDKSKGTRKAGLELIRQALENSLQREGPGLYVMQHCEAFIETVPSIPRDEKDPDDVDTNSIDHHYDSVRYRLLDDKPTYASDIDVDFAW